MGKLEWVAYCRECRKEIDRMANGEFCQAVAQKHADDTEHTVLLGTEIVPKIQEANMKSKD